MIALHAFALVAVFSTPGQPVLLDFYADSCGPCRSMDPVVRRLVSDGFAVRKVNVNREQQLTRRFRVDRVPTFVMTIDDREVDRVVGPANYDRLARMFDVGRPPTARPVSHQQPTSSRDVSSQNARSAPQTNPQIRALHATVRLKVEDDSGNSFGTGTIIDVHGHDALVMTCGHIFRDSGGDGRIAVDLFAPGARGPVTGELISYDLKQDIGLVAIRPGIQVTPAPVASAAYQVRPGDRVFSIGCDHGEQASIRESRVTAINKYLGPANIVAAGEPVIGRSGGGLFSADGQLIGVCNLADPTDKQGIYAALSLLQQNLDKINQSRIYQQNASQIASTRNAPSSPRPDRFAPGGPPAMPKQMPPSPLTGRHLEPVPPTAVAARGPAPHDRLQHSSDDTEIICIVRSKSNPRGTARFYFFDRPTKDLLDRLAIESGRQVSPDPIVLETSGPDASIASRPSPRSPQGQYGDPVVRAQSME
jgi:thiol-disulfide isomerase/thioredoxin